MAKPDKPIFSYIGDHYNPYIPDRGEREKLPKCIFKFLESLNKGFNFTEEIGTDISLLNLFKELNINILAVPNPTSKGREIIDLEIILSSEPLLSLPHLKKKKKKRLLQKKIFK